MKQRGRPRTSFNSDKHARNWSDPLYMSWRQAVRERDGSKCQMPGCSYKGGKIQCHHILPWAKNPTLRYVISNGICLCIKCHKQVKFQEEIYAPLFMRIAGTNQMNNPVVMKPFVKGKYVKKNKK